MIMHAPDCKRLYIHLHLYFTRAVLLKIHLHVFLAYTVNFSGSLKYYYHYLPLFPTYFLQHDLSLCCYVS